MSGIPIVEIVAVAISAIDKVIDMYPNYEQEQVEEWKFLKGEYERELKKPRFDPYKTPEENEDARSTDRLLNLRDDLLRHGEALVKQA